MATITLRPFSIGPDLTFRAHVGTVGRTWKDAVQDFARVCGLVAFNFEEKEGVYRRFTLGTGSIFWVFVEEDKP